MLALEQFSPGARPYHPATVAQDGPYVPVSQSLCQPESLHFVVFHPVQPITVRADPKRAFVVFMHGLYLVGGQAFPP